MNNRHEMVNLFFAVLWTGAWILSGCAFDPVASTSENSDSSVLCGNGTIDPGEECDGQQLNGQTCSDQGYSGGQLGCSDSCRFDFSHCTGAPQCGNGIIEPGEDCDGSQLGNATCQSLHFSAGTLRCKSDCTFDTSDCTIPANCGNGTLDAGEECDDGNNVPKDGCSPSCQKENGWNCDNQSPTHCNPICGDGIVIEGQEECDDGNNDPGDGCDPDCHVEDYYVCSGEPSDCACRVLVDHDSNADPGDGKTWASAFVDLREGIQHAVDAGQNLNTTCEVWVAQGTYDSYVDNADDTFALHDRLKLYGGFCGTETLRSERDIVHCQAILDAAGSKTVVSALGIRDAVLDGFRITGGSGAQCGGGLLVRDSSLAVNHCIFESNTAQSAGAVCVQGTSTTTMFAVEFTQNRATHGHGGALYLENDATVEVRASLFKHNTAEDAANGADGGAVAVRGNASLTVWNSQFNANRAQDDGGAISATGQSLEVHDTSFDSNQADFDGSNGGSGGAIRNGYGSSATIEGCTFSQNEGVVGGAFRLFGGSASITDSLFEQNRATYAAGALGAYGDAIGRGTLQVSRTIFQNNEASELSGAVRIGASQDRHPADARIDNCLFYGNRLTDGRYGGALSVVYGATLALDNCTVTQNSTSEDDGSGGLVAYQGDATIRNSILWHNEGIDLVQSDGAVITVTYSDVPDSNGHPWPGAGNIAVDPLFSDPAHDDYHLQAGSPCIDAAEYLNDPTDIEKKPRSVDQGSVPNSGPDGDFIDMGAYELQ